MSLHLDRPIFIAAAWLAIVGGGAVVGWLGYEARRSELVAALVDNAQRSAVAFEPDELRQLSGTRADLAQPAYIAVKSRLRRLQAVNAKVRFVYLFRVAADTGKVVFLADSAPPGAKDESLPGDEYPEAPTSPGLQEIIRTGAAATEGPLSDNFGTWVTGYALVGALPREILGVDIDAADWSRELWVGGLRRAFYVWVLLGAPLIAWIAVRRQVEQREVIRNFSEAMEQSHSALMIVDLESRIEYANRGLCRQVGYSRRELIGHNWRDFRVADTPEEALTDLVATVRAGRTWEGEWFNRRKDGSVYPVRGVVTPVKRRDGSTSCFVAVFDDVTDFKRREAELREARDLAEAGDRAKSQFLATMSHEVRTPLNGIVGFTSLLLETSLAPEQQEYVQTIRTSGEALIQLTGDILDFARIESGKLKLDPLACDPRECVEDALDLLAARATEKRLELLHHVEDDVPAAVLTDGGRLRQVLVNLLGNAVKFTESGEVEVTVRLAAPAPRRAPDAAPGPGPACLLEFSVRDTGIGIAAEQHTRLFRPFSQIDDSTTRRYGGTGLGLAICKNLVRLMGGDIRFSSEPGRGSTFTFTVRAPVVADPPAPHDLGGLRLGLAAPPGPLRLELARLAASWGSPVVEADSAAALAGQPWDIALVDVSDSIAHSLATQEEPLPGLPPGQTFGLVPISLASDLRHALRTHFRLLANKPIHHESLFALLSGANPLASKATTVPARFSLRVLVVEDNPVNQRLMRRVLTNIGCTLTVAENGRRALEELSRDDADYDIVLLDLHMPEMDGLTALREIRAGHAGPAAQDLWIIALTADAREDQRARALAAGLNDYLTKPLRISDLESAFQRFRAARGATGA